MRRLVITLGAFSSLVGVALMGAAAFQYQDYLEALARFEKAHEECNRQTGQAEFYCGKTLSVGESAFRSQNTIGVASNFATVGILPIGAGMVLFFAGRK